MKAWAVGGAAVVAGLAVYNLFPKKSAVPPAPEPAPVAAAAVPAPTPPTEPAPLPPVVSVTDIDGLLDPPAPPPEPPFTPGVVAVGFEEPVNPFPAVAPEPRPADPELIPPATDVEVAPMPREVLNPPAGIILLFLTVDWMGRVLPDEPMCSDEVRLPAGPLLLDRPAYDPLPPVRQFDPYDLYDIGSRRFADAIHDWEQKANPLTPLWHLTDADLAAGRVEAAGWVGAAARLPAPALPPIRSVRRVFSLLHVPDQVPASRADWYARWHGAGRFPVFPPPAAGVTRLPFPDNLLGWFQ